MATVRILTNEECAPVIYSGIVRQERSVGNERIIQGLKDAMRQIEFQVETIEGGDGPSLVASALGEDEELYLHVRDRLQKAHENTQRRYGWLDRAAAEFTPLNPSSQKALARYNGTVEGINLVAELLGVEVYDEPDGTEF